MTHTYHIGGMTCNSCVARAKSELLKLGDITAAEVQLAEPQATLMMQKHIPLAVLQEALSRAGHYTIGTEQNNESTASQANTTTYKPLLLIGAYIAGITLLTQAAGGGFSLAGWMNSFMAAFFIVFSFFKLLDLRGFAESYAGYDILAKRWPGWGYAYPFVELALGLAYLLNAPALPTNIATLVVMTMAVTGVAGTLLKGRRISCACLGTVFNLPMSTVTLVEDGLMIGMSGLMIALML